MGALIISLLEGIFAITNIWWLDAIIYFIYESVIAFPVAFNLTGAIYKKKGYYNSKQMSNTHWTIRILIMLIPFIVVSIINIAK